MATDPATGQSVATGDAGEVKAGETLPDVSKSGVVDTGWFDTLPDGLKAEKSLETFKGKPITALVESHVSAQKMIGGSLRVPGKDAKPEDVAKFKEEAYSKLGRPESADKYNVKLPVVEGVELTEAQAKTFFPVAHKLGLNDYQVEEILKWDADLTKANAPDHAKDFEKCMTALEKGDDNAPGWGSTTERYVNTAKRTLETMFHPSVAAQIVASGVGNNPEFVRGLARIGKELIEDGLILGEEKGITSDGKGLLEELDKMMADPKSAYHDKFNPAHEAAINRAMDIRRFLGEVTR